MAYVVPLPGFPTGPSPNIEAEGGPKMFRTHAMSVLLCILTLAFADPGLAQAPGNADSVRAAANARWFVADRGAGNKVKVKLLDGTKAEGTIVRIGKSSFELVSSNGKQLSMI